MLTLDIIPINRLMKGGKYYINMCKQHSIKINKIQHKDKIYNNYYKLRIWLVLLKNFKI